jgi:hypothetical protein
MILEEQIEDAASGNKLFVRAGVRDDEGENGEGEGKDLEEEESLSVTLLEGNHNTTSTFLFCSR